MLKYENRTATKNNKKYVLCCRFTPHLHFHQFAQQGLKGIFLPMCADCSALALSILFHARNSAFSFAIIEKLFSPNQVTTYRKSQK